MTPGIRPMVAGNWKMNGVKASLVELTKIGSKITEGENAPEVVVCVPATLLSLACEVSKQTPLGIGGQDCHTKANGAHTGDVSAEMLRDCGADFVIVGHSERRTDHGETNEDVKAKVEAAWRADLQPILCIGETRAERESGKTLDVLSDQLNGSLPKTATARNLVIAYEPIWAIGTGLIPEIADVTEAHGHIREQLSKILGEEGAHMRVLYGGSVKPSNAGELLGIRNVDGALVGGASLKADDFLGIIKTYPDSKLNDPQELNP